MKTITKRPPSITPSNQITIQQIFFIHSILNQIPHNSQHPTQHYELDIKMIKNKPE
jgi:hypothetical protein